MKSKPWQKFPSLLKDWWWLAGIIVGGIVLWGNLPTRMAKAEQKNEKQDEELIDLKGIAREIQGYTKAMNQQQAQLPNANKSVIREWDDTDQTFWCCELTDRQACWDQEKWRRCP